MNRTGPGYIFFGWMRNCLPGAYLTTFTLMAFEKFPPEIKSAQTSVTTAERCATDVQRLGVTLYHRTSANYNMPPPLVVKGVYTLFSPFLHFAAPFAMFLPFRQILRSV